MAAMTMGDNASWRDKPFITIIMEEVPEWREERTSDLHTWS